MNYERFQQVAGDFEKGAFQSYCRNRTGTYEELFPAWYELSYTASELRKTEEEYERYSTAKRPFVVNRLTGDVEWHQYDLRPGAVVEPPKLNGGAVVDCPHCGLRVGIQASKR